MVACTKYNVSFLLILVAINCRFTHFFVTSSSFFGGERKHSHFPKLQSEKEKILTSPSIFADIGTKITIMENILHAFSLDKTKPQVSQALPYMAGMQCHRCEVIVGSAPKCLPTSIPVLSILLTAILYSLQYLYSFPPIVCLFYLMCCLHPCLILLSIQPGILFTYDHLNLPEDKTKSFVVNSIS